MLKKPKKEKVAVPTNVSDASDLLAKIGDMQRIILTKKAEIESRIAALQLESTEFVDPFVGRVKDAATALCKFATTHRDELTNARKVKSAQLATGTIGWRDTPNKVSIKDTGAVLAALEQLKLDDFIRVIKEPNKEAMLADPKRATAIEGIEISSTELFYIQPSELPAEVTAIPSGKSGLRITVVDLSPKKGKK